MKPRRALASAFSAASVFSALALSAFWGCSGTLDSLGGSARAGSPGAGAGALGDAGANDGGASEGGSSSSGGPSGGASNDAGASDGGAVDPGVPTPTKLTPLKTYPNLFRDLIHQSDADIANKVKVAFNQLFHGSVDKNEPIYFELGTDQAYIHDFLHDDNLRTEGLSVCMIVCVELDHRVEFDKLWRYAKANLLQTTGPSSGYFNSICDDDTPCQDPYGMEQFVTALLFAHDRWGSTADMPYGTDALALLQQLRDKEAENGGVVDDVTSVFDRTSALPREQPTLTGSYYTYTRSSLLMPASFELWAQATGDAFWTRAAAAARAGLVASADSKTGLWPIRNYFDGKLVGGSNIYRSAGYRTQFNFALDTAWGGGSAEQTQVADRVLGFFSPIIDTYGASYSTDGTVLDATREVGLIAANGALALSSARTDRDKFVRAVWAQAPPTGQVRYYDGILYLMSVLVLSGNYQIW